MALDIEHVLEQLDLVRVHEKERDASAAPGLLPVGLCFHGVLRRGDVRVVLEVLHAFRLLLHRLKVLVSLVSNVVVDGERP